MVRFHKGMIDVEQDVSADGNNRWLIVDDLMEELSGKQPTNNLLTQHSYYKSLSMFSIVQSMFKKKDAHRLH